MKENWEILGAISLHRIMKKHWIYNNPVYFRAWIDMLWEANHQDKKVSIDSQLLDCPRGSSLNSLETWVNVFGGKWTYDKVRGFFKMLVEDHMITKQRLSKTVFISICNYNKYQPKPKHFPITSQTHTEHSPITSQSLPKQFPTNNNVYKGNNSNKENNVNKPTNPADFPDFDAIDEINCLDDPKKRIPSASIEDIPRLAEPLSIYPLEQFLNDYGKETRDIQDVQYLYAELTEPEKELIKIHVPKYTRQENKKNNNFQYMRTPEKYIDINGWLTISLDRPKGAKGTMKFGPVDESKLKEPTVEV